MHGFTERTGAGRRGGGFPIRQRSRADGTYIGDGGSRQHDRDVHGHGGDHHKRSDSNHHGGAEWKYGDGNDHTGDRNGGKRDLFAVLQSGCEQRGEYALHGSTRAGGARKWHYGLSPIE